MVSRGRQALFAPIEFKSLAVVVDEAEHVIGYGSGVSVIHLSRQRFGYEWLLGT